MCPQLGTGHLGPIFCLRIKHKLCSTLGLLIKVTYSSHGERFQKFPPQMSARIPLGPLHTKARYTLPLTDPYIE